MLLFRKRFPLEDWKCRRNKGRSEVDKENEREKLGQRMEETGREGDKRSRKEKRRATTDPDFNRPMKHVLSD